MLRKIHTSQSRKRFYHEQNQNVEPRSNNITRPPTSHPYSSIRNIRSHETLHSNNYVGRTVNERDLEGNDIKTIDMLSEVPLKQSCNLPKIFVHMLTEMKILFRNRDNKEEKAITSLIEGLGKKISDLYSQNMESKEGIKKLEVEIFQMQGANEELIKKIKKLQFTASHTTHSAVKERVKTKNYQLVIENLKLSQLNAAYLVKINELENNRRQRHVEIKKQVNENESTEVLRYLNRISYLELKLKNAEEKQAEMNQIIENFQKRTKELENKIEGLNDEKKFLVEKQNQWRERAQMQMEDTEMHMTRQNFLLYSIKKLREVNKGLTQKLLNQASSEGHSLKNQIEPNPYFQYEVDFFKSLKSIYFDSKYKQFKMSLTSKKQQSLQFTNFELQEQYLEYRKYEQINLSLFTYYMPRFYSFIEESITSDISNTRIKGNSSVSRVFIQILRAIMKSKLNEFLMLPEQKYTRFPEFVYTWFQRFYFNSQKSDIATLEPYMQKPFSQDLFYRDLLNIKLDQSWQIITFRQFLLQQLNLQQLYFYLMCQNLLFRKAAITKQRQYQGDFSILVEYSAAKLVLDMVLSDFQSWNLSYLISKMREKIIYKKNVEYIDSGFFLRCLVEYYKIERINRYKYIVKLCDEFKTQEKGLRFTSFISIINRFTEVSIELKIRLYRECFCLGRGKITADVIFTVCSEKLIFLKYLKLKCFFKIPLLSTQNNVRSMQLSLSLNKKPSQAVQPEKKPIICLQPSDPYLYKIYTKMMGLARSEGKFYTQLQKLGLIDMMNQFTQMQKVFNEKQLSIDSSILRCRHFMHFLSDMTNKIKVINFTNFYELLEEENKKRSNKSFWIQINEGDLCQILADEFNATVKIYERLAKFIEWKNKVYDFRLHNAARKIQKMVRKKFIAPFMELYKIIYSQFKGAEQPSLKS